MPKRKKKPATEMTTEEMAEHVFPKKVREELKRVAHEKDEAKEKRAHKSSQG